MLAGVEGVRAVSVPDGPAWRDGEQAVPALEATVGGSTALINDFVDSVYGSFPLMLGLIACVTFVLLARAFRSIVLP